MITPPRRSVTRFFIPLIDVLILLFCIFLLMPFVSAPASPEEAAKQEPKPAPAPTDVDKLNIPIPTVTWWTDLPYKPVHGGVRNELYFDWHVAAKRAW